MFAEAIKIVANFQKNLVKEEKSKLKANRGGCGRLGVCLETFAEIIQKHTARVKFFYCFCKDDCYYVLAFMYKCLDA